MAGFGEHLRTGVLSHILIALPAAWLLFGIGGFPDLTLLIAFCAFPATLVGSVIPDFDHHRSHTYRLSLRWVPVWIGASTTVVLLLLAVYLIPRGWMTPKVGFFGGVLAIGSFIGIRRIVHRTLPWLRPPHRGILHSIRMGILLGILIGTYVTAWAIYFGLNVWLLIGVWYSGCFVLGYTSHLLVDWEYLDV